MGIMAKNVSKVLVTASNFLRSSSKPVIPTNEEVSINASILSHKLLSKNKAKDKQGITVSIIASPHASGILGLWGL